MRFFKVLLAIVFVLFLVSAKCNVISFGIPEYPKIDKSIVQVQHSHVDDDKSLEVEIDSLQDKTIKNIKYLKQFYKDE